MVEFGIWARVTVSGYDFEIGEKVKSLESAAE